MGSLLLIATCVTENVFGSVSFLTFRTGSVSIITAACLSALSKVHPYFTRVLKSDPSVRALFLSLELDVCMAIASLAALSTV